MPLFSIAGWDVCHEVKCMINAGGVGAQDIKMLWRDFQFPISNFRSPCPGVHTLNTLCG